jgi:RNA recognition motif-containing protein
MSNTKMYVGNLPFDTTEVELRELFGQHGEVTDAHIMMDRDTGRARGFAFVSMSSKEEMEAAIKVLHGQMLNGRALTVNEARPREERPAGGFGGGGGGGRGGYGGGGGGGGGRGGYGGGGGAGRGGGGGGYGGGGGGGGGRGDDGGGYGGGGGNRW